MKRLIPLFIVLAICAVTSGQNQVDALRYSQLFPGGTARSVALGGAFGALGGDFYSASQNPAGLGVYRGSEITLTPEIYYNSVSSRYNGTSSEDFRTNFNFNNFGYVTAFDFGKRGLIGGSLAIGFNRLNNFHSNVYIEGNNTQSTLADFYVQSANYGEGSGPVDPMDLLPFSEQLFYEGYIMDIDNAGRYYVSTDIRDSLTNNLNIDQANALDRSGKINEWTLAMGFNYEHIVYFGFSLNMNFLDYHENSVFSEYDALTSNWRYFRYNESLDVTGTGYSAKFGLILKPIKFLRLGIAYHTPVGYYLTDTYDASLQSPHVNQVLVPRDYDGYALDAGVFDYRIVTPGKTVGSLGLMLGKLMIFSTDVEYMNYAYMHFPLQDLNVEDRGYFSDVNSDIKNIYNNTLNLKTGLEMRLNKLYLRGGFAYFGSPYQANEANRDAYQLMYSGGIGFREEHFFLDLAVAYRTSEEMQVLYSLDNLANPPSAKLTSGSLKAMATFGFRF
jgi:hypothetical protein